MQYDFFIIPNFVEIPRHMRQYFDTIDTGKKSEIGVETNGIGKTFRDPVWRDRSQRDTDEFLRLHPNVHTPHHTDSEMQSEDFSEQQQLDHRKKIQQHYDTGTLPGQSDSDASRKHLRFYI